MNGSQNEVLVSPRGSHYEVLDDIDSGSFGQVVRAWKKDTRETVAIKIIKNSTPKLVQNEVNIIKKLMDNHPNEYNIVSAFEYFQHRTRYCLVFEILDQNLYDYQKQRSFAPLSLNCIRPILYQVLKALWKLKQLGLVHADLKPENIMLIDPANQPYRVKVIDFGGSFYSNNKPAQPYIQSRFYRSPEIMLGAPFSEAIDMWSLGCVIAELFLGLPLYPGGSEYDMIRYIVSTQGDPPRNLLASGKKTSLFFKRKFHKTVGTPASWRLKAVAEIDTGRHTNNRETRQKIFASLDEMLTVENPQLSQDPTNKYCEQLDRAQFVALLKRLLELDQNQRITPWDSIQHPFLALSHLVTVHNSEYVIETRKRMNICNVVTVPTVVYPPAVPFYSTYSENSLRNPSNVVAYPTYNVSGISHLFPPLNFM